MQNIKPMPKNDLLPGVDAAGCPPRVACDAHVSIRRARRRALVRDALQVSFILAVDYLFGHWPDSRLPFLDRMQSLAFLCGVNLLVVADFWLSRALPKWWARRIAGTWSRRERERFKR
jgi:hypothetical protein